MAPFRGDTGVKRCEFAMRSFASALPDPADTNRCGYAAVHEEVQFEV